MEDVVGTSGADTIVATVKGTASDASTYETGDNIDGGDGVDTLSMLIVDDADLDDELVALTAVENVVIRSLDDAGGDEVQADLWDGVVRIESNRSTAAVEVVDVQSAATLAVTDSAENLTVTFADDAIGAADATLSVVVDGAGTAAADSVIAVNIGGDDAFTALNVNASGDASYISVDIDVESLESIVVTGNAALELAETGDNFDDVTSFDASGNTGGVTWATDDEVLTTLKGGSGDDAFSIDDAVDADAVIELGAGDDTLTADDTELDEASVIDGGSGTDTISSLAINNTIRAAIKNFETLELAGETRNLDMSRFTNSTFKDLKITDAALGGTMAVSGLAGSSVNLTVSNESGAAVTFGTLTATLASSSGASDSATINLDAADEDVTVTALTVGGMESIVINTNGDGVAAHVNTLSDLNDTGNSLTTITINGDQNFVLSDVDTNTTAVAAATTNPAANLTAALTLIDASAATGDITIAAGERTAFTDTTTGTFYFQYNNLVIKGGAGDDTLTHNAAAAGTVYAGSGDDTVTLEGVGAVAHLGEGSDGVTVSGTGQTIYADIGGDDEAVDTVTVQDDACFTTTGGAFASSSKITTIEGLSVGDVINVTDIEITADTPTDYTDTADAFLTLIDAINGALAANVISSFEYDGNTYLAINGAVTAGEDAVIKLIGTGYTLEGTNGVITLA